MVFVLARNTTKPVMTLMDFVSMAILPIIKQMFSKKLLIYRLGSPNSRM